MAEAEAEAEQLIEMFEAVAEIEFQVKVVADYLLRVGGSIGVGVLEVVQTGVLAVLEAGMLEVELETEAEAEVEVALEAVVLATEVEIVHQKRMDVADYRIQKILG